MRPTGHHGVCAGPGRTAAGVVGVIAAVVLGVLGMHGFTLHGAVPVGGTAHHPVLTSSDASTTQHGHHTVGGTEELCLAMLLTAASGVLLALLLRRVAHAGRLQLAPLHRRFRNVAAAGAGAGPPYLWDFSVVRC